MHLLKVTVFTLLLASINVFAINGLRIGAKVGGGYNAFWGLNNTINLYQDVDNYYIEKADISGLNKAHGAGFSFGVTTMAFLTNNLSLVPELLISYRARSTEYEKIYQGWRKERNRNEEYWVPEYYETKKKPEISIKQWFIDVPVYVRCLLFSGVFVEAGPVLSLNLKSEAKTSIYTADIGEYTTTVVLGFGGNLGYSIFLGNGYVIDIAAGGQLGMTSLVNKDAKELNGSSFDASKLSDPKDLIINFSVGFWFL